MNLKKAVLFLVLISLFSFITYGQVAFRDVGYQSYPFGTSPFGFGIFGYNPLDSLCFNYSWLVDFVVLFLIFYFIAHQTFGKNTYKKGDIASLAVALALSFGLARWAAFRGGLVCGILSGGFGGAAFGNIFGLLVLLGLVFLILWAFVKGSSASRVMAAVGYVIFYFWLGSEGGYILSGWSYYIPVDPFLMQAILQLLLIVSIMVGGYSLFRWRKEG